MIRPEHAGAKNGGGFWGRRAEAKRVSRKLRRRADLREAMRSRVNNANDSQRAK